MFGSVTLKEYIHTFRATAAETAAAAEQRHTMERDTLAAQTAALGQELADARQEIEALRQQSAEYLAEKVRAQESVRP